MTTLDPGARVVLTHGLAASPRSTALRASRAAPSMTCGLDVLVQDVMAAITTAPWSSSNWPAAVVTGTRSWGRSLATGRLTRGESPTSSCPMAGGSLAGNDSDDAWSAEPATLGMVSPATYPRMSWRHWAFASESETRSWGRFGPAMDGTT